MYIKFWNLGTDEVCDGGGKWGVLLFYADRPTKAISRQSRCHMQSKNVCEMRSETMRINLHWTGDRLGLGLVHPFGIPQNPPCYKLIEKANTKSRKY